MWNLTYESWDFTAKILTCAEAARSISPPCRRCRLSVCGSGRPSFSQVKEGVGIPEASQWSSRTLLTTTDTCAATPEPFMRGGSNKERRKTTFLFPPVDPKLRLETQSRSSPRLTQHFQAKVAASCTSCIVSHAGVVSCIIDLGLDDLHCGIQVDEFQMGVWN